MESYGDLLKRTREGRAIDLDTASYETTISLQYLQALETEDEGVFPGEPYMLGFMRTYASYLGLSPDNLCALYRAKKLQEAPTPEGLIVHEKPHYYYPVIIVIVLLVLSGGGFGAVYLWNMHKQALVEAAKNIISDDTVKTATYEVTDNAQTVRVYIGDQFRLDGVVLTVCDTKASLGISCPIGTLYTALSEENELDIDGDNKSDIIVYVSDISQTDSERGAQVRVLRANGLGATEIATIESVDTTTAANHKPVEIFRDNRAYPFTLNGNFRGSCLFRYKVDRKEPTETYFTTGEIVTMTANNGIRLWISNCNAVKLSVIADSRNYDLTIGKAGQVLFEDIKWIKDTTDGKYKLVIIEGD